MIKKGLNVKILTGKDKNKTGEVIEVDRNNDRVKVKKGGIFEKENFIHISNVVILKTEKKKETSKQKWHQD